MEPTDQEWLIRFITERDETAFAALVRRYEGLVRSVCRRVLRDHHLAEDAFQAVFLILAGQAPTLARRTGPLAGCKPSPRTPRCSCVVRVCGLGIENWSPVDSHAKLR